MRLDQYLVILKKCRSRTQALEWIRSGLVLVFLDDQWKEIKKPSFPCEEGVQIKIKNEEALKWVSRAGLKLDFALKKLKLELEGKSVLDLGQSTGGFSQACLLHGAAHVCGVDVGTDQVSDVIRRDERVLCYEKQDARDLSFLDRVQDYSFLVVDLSFVSVLKVLPEALRRLSKGTQALVLIKPQFEVGRWNVGKGGLVDSSDLHLQCEKKILTSLEEMECQIYDYFPSGLKGKDGNQEFFCFMCI